MKRKFLKFTSVFLAVTIFLEVLYPTAAYALTGGPSQPEVQSFEPVGSSDMVNLFTGDFVYNIPLLDVEGYPVNISYHSGISMDQEASWVGLGWNINPGVINRNMRGIPDDFDGSKGDKIKNTFNTKPNRTYGVKGGMGIELMGLEPDKTGVGVDLNFGLGVQYNNYQGVSIDHSVSASVSAGKANKGRYNGSLGLTSSSNTGLSIAPSVSYSSKQRKDMVNDQELTSSTSGGLSTSFNSRAGVKAVSLDFNTNRSTTSYSIGKNKEGQATLKSHTVTYPSNGGSAITFGMNTYTPPVMMPTSNAAVTFSAKIGGTFFAIDGTSNVTGYYSEQRLRRNSESVPAYGYFNSDKGANNPRVMHDFNREKDGSFSANTPALPLTNYTYDVYSVNGQGIGGMYRPFRNEVGHVYEKNVSNTSSSYSLGVEIAGGNAVKSGGDVSVVDVYTTSGMWKKGNDAINKLKFSSNPENLVGYEKFYFKEAGEKSVQSDYKEGEDSFFSKAHSFKAVRLGLEKRGGLEVGVSSKFVDENNETHEFSNSLSRTNRQKRNQAIYYLTVEEAAKHAIDNTPFVTDEETKMISNKAKAHHIGEITALRPDGSRFIYGIPAYNNDQKEVTFAVGDGTGSSGHEVNEQTGTVEYNGTDDGLSNKRGIDNYYQRTDIPGYAHSYLLTSVLSHDYLDNDTVRGPSEGDMGNYTKFNYSKTNPSYKWRTPVGTKIANFNEGLLSLDNDNKANYLYGEKEIWYLESIETKNYIAKFITGQRADGLGVSNQAGTLNVSLEDGYKVLKKIELYVKSDYVNNSEAVPLKTVHFEYDYSLCKGVDNNILKNDPSNTIVEGYQNQGGKLTLKKIYFTYQKSGKGRFSPYEFTYGSNNSLTNPDYGPKAYDRWGNYKPLVNNKFSSSVLEPYVEQNKENADLYASAWNLSKVELPSGGIIDVEYESDDYAYIQDKPAMQMFKVRGITNSDNFSESSDLYNNSLGAWISSSNHNTSLHVDIPEGTTVAEFRENYLQGIENLYFKFKVDMTKDKGKWEMVPGYAKIVGSTVDSDNNTGVIFLNSVGLGEKAHKGLQINPITKAALQYSRLYTPTHAYNEPDATDGGIEQVLMAMLNSSFSKNIAAMLLGINGDLLSKGHCSNVDLNHCYVRLNCPTKGNNSPHYGKLGGGARVKSVKISDEASSMNMGNTNTYGQLYEYTTETTSGEIISSGVASYEPLLGGEENPFRKPLPFGDDQEQKYLVPDDRFYMELPFGESFFPSPVVGYSKVTVSSFQPEGVNIKKHGTGKIVHEFYTAKDFPIITKRTDLHVVPEKSRLALRLLKLSNKDFLHASQGFVVELNDMHGKPKGQWSYAEGQNAPISGIEYKYKSKGNRLDNEALVIDHRGNVQDAQVGVDFDMVVDTKQQETEIHSYGLNGNLAAFFAAFFAASVPLILPAYAKEHTRFRSAVVTKVINRYGILEETVAHDLGSVVSTKNLAFDSETGELLLKEVKNNYDDPVYDFTYPAHWVYDGMGQAYKNVGLEFELEFDQGDAYFDQLEHGVISKENIHNFFHIGDELVVLYNQFESDENVQEEIKHKFWITAKDDKHIFVMGGSDRSGCQYPLNGTTRFKVIRSGRKNMQTLPIGQVTCLVNPIKTNEAGNKIIDFDSENMNVLNSMAVEYSHNWGLFCSCGIGDGDTENPYYRGGRGRWRMKKSHTYLTGRTKTDPHTVLRNDGVYESYSSFWKKPEGDEIYWSKYSTDPNWKWVNEVTNYDPYSGSEIENKNALDIYSSAKNGYYHSAPVLVAPNSRYKEIFYDNFEDYDINSCNEDLSKFNNGTTDNLDFDSKAHTGRKSLKVSKEGSSVKLSINPKF